MANEKSWLIMLYLAADDLKDGNLRTDSLEDNCVRLLESIRNIAKIDPSVKIVALLDNNARPDCDRTATALRYHPSIWCLKSTRDTPGQSTNEWVDVGKEHPTVNALFTATRVNTSSGRECDTGDFRTLSLFVDWALANYPHDHTMLAIVSHGGGWAPTLPYAHREISELSYIKEQGAPKSCFFSEDTKERRAPIPSPDGSANTGGGWQKKGWSPGLTGLAPDYTSDTAISTQELRLALELGLRDHRTKIDILFLDACLMSMIEVAYEIRENVNYVVAGQNLLWASLPYRTYFERNNALQLPADPEELARGLVENYNRGVTQKPWEISAIKATETVGLAESINHLSSTLCAMLNDDIDDALLALIFNAYQAAQKFDYDADFTIETDTEGYVDLYDFANKLIEELTKSSDSRTQEVIDIAEHIKCVIGDKSRSVFNITAGVSRPQPPEGGSSICKNPGMIIAARTQSDNIDRRMVLDDAYGLSIYLPLGEKERHDNNAVVVLTGQASSDDETAMKRAKKTLLEYYCDPTQLQFTRDVPKWSELVKLLIDRDAQREHPRRDRQARQNAYQTLRQKDRLPEPAE
jgi:hypothetical protein